MVGQKVSTGPTLGLATLLALIATQTLQPRRGYELWCEVI